VSTTRTVAAFDFDGTLTRRDTLLPFLASYSGRTQVLSALALSAPGSGGRDALKERLLTRVLRGHAHSDVLDAGRRFGAELVHSGISPEMRSRLAWHRREGHEVVIVSATLDVYLDEVGRALGVQHVLCTSLDVDENARVTGGFAGANCRGIEKAARLRAFVDEETVTWAYGDSAGDREMLAMADHPVRVRRGRLRL
jgi:phosphatidylglycerophosphatase C